LSCDSLLLNSTNPTISSNTGGISDSTSS
jgi:hypothetical protein